MRKEVMCLGKKACAILFAVYCGMMIMLLFEPWNMNFDGADYHLNLHPFETICGYFYILRTPEANAVPSLHSYAVTNLAGNIVMFIPLGYFLARRIKKFWLCIPVCICVITLIELLQLYSGVRSCDIDDLILNTLGCVIGYALSAVLQKKHDRA